MTWVARLLERLGIGRWGRAAKVREALAWDDLVSKLRLAPGLQSMGMSAVEVDRRFRQLRKAMRGAGWKGKQP